MLFLNKANSIFVGTANNKVEIYKKEDDSDKWRVSSTLELSKNEA